MFIAALLTIAKTWKHTDIHTHTMEYYSAIEKNEVSLLAATQMNLEGNMLSEISQTEKDKYHMMSCIFGNLKNTRN